LVQDVHKHRDEIGKGLARACFRYTYHISSREAAG
jgi:hypothetical protein